ncbi:JAB/MPN domain [Macleaya cordata]|uniref:JAB/MPN domain n=1 Tax=Macleaya cordata TaxID=56857 RepID=A0A200Q3B9_MACCD|nr:JAB/MPN domain [Macleaya cordata]
MRTSSRGISVAANAQKLHVDNRISLRFYYRIADNLLKQADIFREEKNIIDLYVMLLRFSSLITETIPCHKDYKLSLPRQKLSCKKKLLDALSELESLKPAVQQQIEGLNRKSTSQVGLWGDYPDDSSLEWPPVKKQTPPNYEIRKTPRSVERESTYQSSWIPRDKFSHARPIEEQFRKISLTIPRPKDETLSRHSILGPNGLSGQWQPPKSDRGVQYPSNIDLSPIEIPSLQQPVQDGIMMQKDSRNAELESSTLESVLSLNDDSQPLRAQEPCPMISLETVELPIQIDIVRQPSPPPVLADVKDLMPVSSPEVAEAGCGLENSLQDELARSKSPLELHISTSMMETFMRLAKSNTKKNLETCGVLAGLLKNRKFFVSALIIPKQESTSDTCQTMNEEEIFDVQDKQSLFPLGWIHTHPSQSCFMSSVDLHTHYSYQIMLPEAIAIVMAPKDGSRTHGIFRLTSPGGMSVIRKCPQRGFHPHEQPSDGRASGQLPIVKFNSSSLVVIFFWLILSMAYLHSLTYSLTRVPLPPNWIEEVDSLSVTSSLGSSADMSNSESKSDRKEASWDFIPYPTRFSLSIAGASERSLEQECKDPERERHPYTKVSVTKVLVTKAWVTEFWLTIGNSDLSGIRFSLGKRDSDQWDPIILKWVTGYTVLGTQPAGRGAGLVEPHDLHGCELRGSIRPCHQYRNRGCVIFSLADFHVAQINCLLYFGAHKRFQSLVNSGQPDWMIQI